MVAATCALVGCGRLAFDPIGGPGVGDANVITDGTLGLGADGLTGPPAMFVATLGSNTCGNGSLSLTVAQGIPMGHRLIAVLVLRRITTGAVAFADTRGNAYTIDRDQPSVGVPDIRIDVASTTVTQPLVPGDQVTSTFPSGGGSVLIVDDMAGLGAPTATTSTTGSNAMFSYGVTVATLSVLYCVFTDYNHLALTPSWIVTNDVNPMCGGVTNNPGVWTGYGVNSGTGSLDCSGTHLMNTHPWAGAAVAYQAP
jgi:hypothetical protein